MNKSLIAVLGIAVVLAAGASVAQEAKAPVPPTKAAQAASGVDTKAQMARMDEHMKKMQALHDKMMSATTPEERQKVMDEARKEMQESMTMMQPMMQGGGMMGGMGGGMMGQKGAPDTSTQMQMMSRRMDMMQMMMQMMMDQQGMMGGPKAPDIAPKK